MSEQELPDVTAEQLRAMRECRFVTVNRTRTLAFGIDSDQQRVAAVGFSCCSYQRAPGAWEYEWQSEHPQMVAAVEKRLGLDARR